MLPKPTYTGGAPASRNASRSAGSGRSSGRIHAPVCTTSRSGVACHGPRTGSAASHGPVGEDVVADVVHRRQADRRPVGVQRLAEQRVDALGVQLPQHPVVGLLRRERLARPRQRRVVRRRQPRPGRTSRTRRGCPASRPPTARRPAGIKPVATSASHPSAAAASASNCAATNSAARRGSPARRRRPRARAPARAPTGRAAPAARRHRASSSANSSSGGAHTRTSAPSSRNCTASPTSGSTSPRDPYVDNNTRIRDSPFPQVLASAGDSAARPGSCRKPPGALYVESGREWELLPFALSSAVDGQHRSEDRAVLRAEHLPASRVRSRYRGAMPAKPPAVEIEVDDRVVRVSNPDRVYFPESGATKLDLVEYYLAVGPGIVNALFERPCMLHRFPKGLAGDKVHQKRLPAGAPPWVETVQLHFPRWNRTADELCVTELGQRDLGGADVDRRVPPLEQPARGHREAGRVAHRPRPGAVVRLRRGAAGRGRRPRGARRPRRRRVPEDQRRRGPARLRPDPARRTASRTYAAPRSPSPARSSGAPPTT